MLLWSRTVAAAVISFAAVATVTHAHGRAIEPANTEVSGHSAPALSSEEWQARTRIDLAAFADALRKNYIYAAYPDPARWHAWFDGALADVEVDIPLVHDEAGYQAVLRHMAAALQDAHVYVQFEPATQISVNWPGFLVRFDNGTYRITASRQSGVADGEEVSSCDGEPMAKWISTVAQLEVGLPDTLEVTRNNAALRLSMDRGTPLRLRPAQCIINGREVTLDWVPAPVGALNPVIASLQGWRPAEVGTRSVGDDGAWVKLGYFGPEDAVQAEAFQAVIAEAPTLRNKRFIVLDVRGNGGGPYNWFMAYLRGLYGQEYADHYATARLNIRAAYRLSPAYVELDREDKAAASAFEEPADAPYEINDALNDQLQERAIAAGEPIFLSAPLSVPIDQVAPLNPVRAQVYVLTNYACASACIAFVDEMKRFPGVRQIGLPTHVDSRSGTAVEIVLPSGLATANIAAMTRNGRIRDDNEPQLPSIRFKGDMHDDNAVEGWFLQEVAGT